MWTTTNALYSQENTRPHGSIAYGQNARQYILRRPQKPLATPAGTPPRAATLALRAGCTWRQNDAEQSRDTSRTDPSSHGGRGGFDAHSQTTMLAKHGGTSTRTQARRCARFAEADGRSMMILLWCRTERECEEMSICADGDRTRVWRYVCRSIAARFGR